MGQPNILAPLPERLSDTSIVSNIFALGVFPIYLNGGKKKRYNMWELMIQSKVSEKMSCEESQKIRLNLQIFPTYI